MKLTDTNYEMMMSCLQRVATQTSSDGALFGEMRLHFACTRIMYLLRGLARESLNSEFLASFAASRYGKRYFLSAAKQTTNLASVNASQLKLMPMPLPTLPEQLTIVAALDGVDGAIVQARQEWNGLQLLKASAADALLTGRVQVENI